MEVSLTRIGAAPALLQCLACALCDPVHLCLTSPISQSQRFDPDGRFIRQWLPELASLSDKAIHDPHAGSKGQASLFGGGVDYPKPIVDLRASRQRALDAFKNLPSASNAS